ncbi:hypothetical protein H4R33_006421 [Dimargaris cristalligena]|uniref:Uncharacterized protein n=1 Tax=Dimargaris cristalligena TaxID=215637 RepID=A0A4P9ZPA1_9FUNG|nr:hypothetical protein H4R33_006421 [Dimargaris cristalligena]RKP34170.1 hypothetical protein BJ085DRAFT_29499 [Dimargaris cristalligena]|eukprot:RKP34170.1 hypothetical protein BJ085DRAFT_29499 [Dimargaris cristalligena]
MKVYITSALLAVFSFTNLGRAADDSYKQLNNVIDNLLFFEIRGIISDYIPIGDFALKAAYLYPYQYQSEHETTNQINKPLEDTAIEFQTIETVNQRASKNSAQQILKFTAEFYSLARLGSWVQIMGSFLGKFQHLPLNLINLDESFKNANGDTMVYLEKIYRSISTHVDQLCEPQSTMDTHFRTDLQLNPELMNTLQLAHTPVGGSIELVIPMMTWYLHHRQRTDEFDGLDEFGKFFTVLLRPVPSEAEGNNPRPISRVASSVTYFSLTLAAIQKDPARVEMLSEQLATVKIFNSTTQLSTHTLERQKRLFLECLAARDLTDVAQFLARSWGIEFSQDYDKGNGASCWFRYFGSRWFMLAPEGELGVQVPTNLLGIALEANQYMEPSVQTDFPSFRAVEKTEVVLYGMKGPLLDRTMHYTIKHSKSALLLLIGITGCHWVYDTFF